MADGDVPTSTDKVNPAPQKLPESGAATRLLADAGGLPLNASLTESHLLDLQRADNAVSRLTAEAMDSYGHHTLTNVEQAMLGADTSSQVIQPMQICGDRAPQAGAGGLKLDDMLQPPTHMQFAGMDMYLYPAYWSALSEPPKAAFPMPDDSLKDILHSWPLFGLTLKGVFKFP